MRQTGSGGKNGPGDHQAEQREEVRQSQVEDEALRHGGASQMAAEFYDHEDVSRDPQKAAEHSNHASSDVRRMAAGQQRRYKGGAVGVWEGNRRFSDRGHCGRDRKKERKKLQSCICCQATVE